ncbi:hypothetical protein ACFPL7_05775 [Dongia soli]|uniref:Uncharacterized protein n=1 Tax=Dongia soli TaxID=600628 RepID=A0ABU5EFM8_9PROT|nr:hypothetical protein [Dongia soli]MDY0884910.1 hypothetical protein [Dongia soli]
MSSLLRPEDLSKIANDAETAKMQKALDLKRVVEDEKKSLRDAFMHRDLRPDVDERVNKAIRRAAEDGFRELMAVSFPASYCNDGGRRINNLEPDWPVSLEGFAKIAYDYYQEKLHPMGYRLTARVLDYPGGFPGEVGLFLSW